SLLRDGVLEPLVRAVITGDVVRDWRIDEGDWAFAPYDTQAKLVPLDIGGWGRRQWPFRVVLGGVTGFGGQTRADAGEPWWAWYRWVAQRYRTPLTITFAFVTTHNHFVLDRGGKVFNRSAPVIKLPEWATEGEHLALLGVLNSSTACFWLRQNSHNKGRPGAELAGADEPWEQRYEFTGTTIEDYPLPAVLPLERGRVLDGLARESALHEPASRTANCLPTASVLAEAQATSADIRARMVAVQE